MVYGKNIGKMVIYVLKVIILMEIGWVNGNLIMRQVNYGVKGTLLMIREMVYGSFTTIMVNYLTKDYFKNGEVIN
jgi:hypothetical protein